MIVENKAGANGNIAASYVAKAPGDGSVLFLTSVGAVSISPRARRPALRSGARLRAGLAGGQQRHRVRGQSGQPGCGCGRFRQALAGRLAAGGGGSSGIAPDAGDRRRQPRQVMHVPCGAAPVINDVMGNQVAGFFGDVPGLIGHIQGGQGAGHRRAVAPSAAAGRQDAGRAGHRRRGVQQLVRAGGAGRHPGGHRGQAQPGGARGAGQRRARLEKFGAQAAPSSPQELAALIASDRDKWTALIQRKLSGRSERHGRMQSDAGGTARGRRWPAWKRASPPRAAASRRCTRCC